MGSEGVRCTIPPSVFSRYSYFQTGIGRIFPRLERVIKDAGLNTCTHMDNLSDLAREVSSATNNPTITLFECDTSTKPRSLQQPLADFVRNLDQFEPETVRQEMLVMEDLQVEGRTISEHALYVIVFNVNSNKESEMTLMKNDAALLCPRQRENTIIYDKSSQTVYQYLDVERAEFDLSSVPSSEKCPMSSVSRLIEKTWERRIVGLLENVAGYADQLVPRMSNPQDRSLQDEMFAQLMSLKEPTVQLDLEPKPFGTDEENNERFSGNIIVYLETKTKCVICNYMAAQYGIPAHLINDILLNPNLFNYKRKYQEVISTIDDWPTYKEKFSRNMHYFTNRLAAVLSDLVRNTETFIKEKVLVLESVYNIQREVFALLRRAKVPVKMSIPETPKLPVELQKSLLQISEVTGCGTICGKLTLHSKTHLTISAQEEVNQLLIQHRYPYGYTVHQVAGIVEQVRTFVRYDSGQALKAKLTPQGHLKMQRKHPGKDISKHVLGSVGCFMMLQKLSNSAEAEHSKDLCAITCGHCVKDCEPVIEAPSAIGIERFGTVEAMLYQPKNLDIAAIKVLPNKVQACDTNIKLPCGVKSCRRWGLFDGDISELEDRPIYKRGSVTNTTEGVIKSVDFMHRAVNELPQDDQADFQLERTILIGYGDGQPPDARKPFSDEGDSGSVVCDLDLDNKHVSIVSLLQGCVHRDLVFLYSYSSHMKKCMDSLCEKHGYRYEIPPAPHQNGIIVP